MAKGISENDVHQAADALVAAGERPTVERIRGHLGTGSPNTVTRWLDTWWQKLGGRLAIDRSWRSMPDAPSAIAALATELWEQALIAARTEADASLAEDRAALAAERVDQGQQLAQSRREVADYKEASALAEQGRMSAESRLLDAERLIKHQEDQVKDLSDQRHDLIARLDAFERERAMLAEQLQQQEAAARIEREALAQHARALEDRSHAEIDRARQEARSLQRRIEVLVNEHAVQQLASERRLEEGRAALAEAIRTSSIRLGRAEALEEQVARLSEWQATQQLALSKVRASARRSNAAAPDPATRTKRPRRKPGEAPKNTV